MFVGEDTDYFFHSDTPTNSTDLFGFSPQINTFNAFYTNPSAFDAFYTPPPRPISPPPRPKKTKIIRKVVEVEVTDESESESENESDSDSEPELILKDKNNIVKKEIVIEKCDSDSDSGSVEKTKKEIIPTSEFVSPTHTESILIKKQTARENPSLYFKNYYAKNKKRIETQRTAQRFICGCGANVKKSDKHQHLKTKKHIDFCNPRRITEIQNDSGLCVGDANSLV